MTVDLSPSEVTVDSRSDAFVSGKSVGFRKAAGLYVQAGGEDRYLRPLIDYFGDTPLEEISQDEDLSKFIL